MAGAATASRLGLVSCHACTLVCKDVASADVTTRCPRCGTPVHRRKPNSIARTWALVIASAILYIPANLLPIMETSSLFDSQEDTIMSGVIFLWKSGSWMVAAIVFTASIMVPMFKLVALALLLLSVQRPIGWRPLQRAKLFRVVDFVGRWSMLDIYVVAVLVGLVQLQTLAFIRAGPASVAFGGVVVLTMFAALSFDPRLIWDSATDQDD